MQQQTLLAAFALGAAILASTAAGAATVNVSVQNYRFNPNDITIHVGDTVHWVNNSGQHSVIADDGSFIYTNGSSYYSSWVYNRTFNTASVVRYYCGVHSAPGLDIDQNMNGRITVLDATPPPPPPPVFQINQGIAGTWYNPPTGGQGFLFDIRPSDKFMFVAWFTFDKAAPAQGAMEPKLGATEQRWFTISGTYDADKAVNATITSTSGGIFNTVHQATNTAVGTATITFTSCTAGTVAYDIPGDGLSGTIAIQRAIPGTENICTMLAAATPQ